MDSARWQHVKRVLEEALGRPPGLERERFLDAACAEDDALRAEVVSLIEADAEADSFLYTGAIALPEVEARLFQSDERLGPYRVTGEIGRGGMGTVYRAVRDDAQYTREVALKIIRPGLYTEAVTARFLTERQILATLEHPNIARLYDGGVTEDGRPYFVMEYVQGQPLDTYCDEKRLSIRERLRLFAEVARTVAYAHAKLVVHRDLKPSNILVVENGPEGRPSVKLLDFGVAKLLREEDAAAAAPVTQTGLQLMTPEYAAPEQVRGEAISTATDVYALGVLLYELLTGRRPYRFGARTPSQIERVICEVAPTRPSTVVTAKTSAPAADEDADAPTAEALSRARRTEAGRLRRTLRGDLDTIVLKALRKEPERRYASAEGFAEDVERYLAGLPVAARKDTVRYRAAKFVKRHRWGVALAVLVALLLVGYAATVTRYAQEVARERDRAQTEAAKAEQTAAFLAGLFQRTDPTAPEGRAEMTVRAVLDEGAARIRTDLADQPLVQAEMMETIGGVYTNLGLYPEAEPLLREALAQRRRVLGPGDPGAASVLTRLGYMLFRQGRFEESDAAYREALALLDEAGTEARPEDRISALNDFALLQSERGQPSEAEALYREALSLTRASGDSSVTTLIHNLAIALQDQNKFDAALPLHREALARFQEEHGGAHPDVANAMARLAFTLQRKGDEAAAESLHWQALEMRRALLPPEHPHIASSLVRLGWLLVERGRPAEAEPLLREGIAILEARLPSGHWQTVAARGALGTSLAAQGRFAEGEAPLLKSYALFSRAFGPEDWRTQSAARALAGLYAAWGRPEEAATYQAVLSDAAE